MQSYNHLKKLALGLSLLVLSTISSCGGTSVADAVAALKGDTNSFCVHVENNYPPFQNQFTLLRSGQTSTTVSGTNGCVLVNGTSPGITTPATTVTVPTVAVPLVPAVTPTTP